MLQFKMNDLFVSRMPNPDGSHTCYNCGANIGSRQKHLAWHNKLSEMLQELKK